MENKRAEWMWRMSKLEWMWTISEEDKVLFAFVLIM